MIFKSVTLFNFGIYAGNNSMELSGVTSEKPIILVGGLNGRGKTTILEAILLALYGKNSLAVIESKLSYSDYLRKFINTSSGNKNVYIELEIQIFPNSPIITIRREWSEGTKPINDKLTIYQNTQLDVYMADNWEAYIETILPAGISKLFFFDGEKINEAAKDKTDNELKRSIQMLLGIDTIERLILDYNKVIFRQYNEEKEEFKDGLLLKLELELKNFEIEAQEIFKKINKTDSILKKLQKQRSALQQKIIKEGGDIFLKKVKLEEKRNSLKKLVDSVEQEIGDLISGAMPLALTMPLIKNIARKIEKEESLKKDILISDALMEIKTSLASIIDKEKFSNESEQKIRDLFKPYERCDRTEKLFYYNASPIAINQLKDICGYKIEQNLLNMKELIDCRNAYLKEISTLDYYLNNDLKEAEIKRIKEELDIIDREIIENSARKKILEEQSAKFNLKIIQIKKSIRLKKQEVLESEKNRECEARIVRYLNYSINVMEEFKLKLQEEKVSMLEESINNRFKMIVGKRNLIDKITIDKETLDILVYDTKGNEFSKTKLSAGERQMFVISILWGLASCLEIQLPVIIDTPLSRLDSIHRKKIVCEYLPNAGEQVIILSTDEEINGAYTEMILPHVARSYLLKFDENSQSTSISSGYFEK